MSPWILSDDVCLIPGPVTTHEVSVALPLPSVKLLEWSIVEVAIEVAVCKQVVHDLLGVVVPDIVACSHPLQDFVRMRTIIICCETLPGHIPNDRCINFCQEIIIACEKINVVWASPMSNESGAYKLGKCVD